MKKQEKEKLQKRYNNLSLEERNAYEQIVERSHISFIGIPYAFIRIAIDFGLFFVLTAIIVGVPIQTFSEAYTSLLSVFFLCIPITILLIIIFIPINIFRRNKLKRKLLSN